jgi:hypothetical protein
MADVRLHGVLRLTLASGNVISGDQVGSASAVVVLANDLFGGGQA